MTTKHCPQCGNDLPELHFAACHSRPDGLARTCRCCDSGRREAANHRDSARRARKRWSLAHFAEPTWEMVR